MYNLSDSDFIGDVQFIGHHVCYDITIKVNKSLNPEEDTLWVGIFGIKTKN